MDRQNLISGIVASMGFIVFYSLFKWHILAALLLALGLFFGIYFITKPVKKIGDLEVEAIKDGLTLHALYAGALKDLLEIEETNKALGDSVIEGETKKLAGMGRDILNYLEDNPKEISKSRHFLEYYYETARKIIVNYSQLKMANISEEKFGHITDKTIESLHLLQKIFAHQRDSYHEDKVMALEVENDLLEKTIKLSGGDRE